VQARRPHHKFGNDPLGHPPTRFISIKRSVATFPEIGNAL
jgi:hypothetical protein